MWTRADLKERGKLCFHRNYAASVLAGLMIIIATASIGGSYDVRGTVNGVVNDSSYSADISLPNVFNNMAGGRIWGCAFFIFMSFAALSTVIADRKSVV